MTTLSFNSVYRRIPPVAGSPLLTLILVAGGCLRIAAAFYLVDLNDGYYWEYGEIGRNLIHGEGYSLWYFDTETELLEHRYQRGTDPAPSAYMPPGYIGVLLPFLLIEHDPTRNVLLLLLQIGLGTLSIYLLFRLSRRLFAERTSIVAAAAASFLPEFLYAPTSFTPTILFHVLILLLFLLLVPRNGHGPDGKEQKKGIGWWDIGVGLTMVGIVMIRTEFGLFILLYLGVMIWRRRVLHVATIGTILALSILPWTIRNYVVFDRFIPLTTSFGINFFRGHNPYGIGHWGEVDIVDSTISRREGKNLELWMNQKNTSMAIDFLKEDPLKDVARIPVKLFLFWGFDPKDRRSSHPLNVIPTLLLLVTGVIGIAMTRSWDRYYLFYLFFIYSSLVVIIFFPLPRYGTMSRILLLPFAAEGILWIVDRLRKKKD